jgi:two-component system alkaline phosphatase synthesis response regulator PhoP
LVINAIDIWQDLKLLMENSNIKILLVDDEPDILEFMEYNLKKEGYQVLQAKNGKEAVEIARREIPHLVILDIMMPIMDGIEACRVMREIPELQNTLITFLTARNEEYSQLAGFDVGADDYITKPIKPRIMLSRVKALLRRLNGSTGTSTPVVQIGNLKIDRESYLVYKDDESIVLPRKEFELLALLTSKPGKVFTREDILSRVWGSDIVVGDRTIDVHIRKIREKLGDESIKTIKGIGYKFDI